MDTWKAEVAEAVLEAGAGIINDITGLFGSDEMAAVIAKYDAAVILMFNATMYRTQDSKSAVFPAFQEGRGLPVSLSQELNSIDLMSACHKFLLASLERALSAGISAQVSCLTLVWALVCQLPKIFICCKIWSRLLL